MEDELLYTQEDINEWIRTCEELQEQIKEQEYELTEFRNKIENGTLIELPRIIHPNKAEWFVQYQYQSGIIQYDIYYSQEQAEAKLKELQVKE